jgi:sodium-coupled monocarboxylate transporter 8/12/insulin-like growth factor 2 mRNA-binding protein 1
MLYVPALAFNQMTDVNIHKITPIVMAICILYTCLGGIKAVVYTDLIQILIMYGTLIIIAVMGTINAGGFSEVIKRNIDSQRFEAPE